MLSAEMSNISLESYSTTDDTKIKVNLDNSNKLSLAGAKANTTKPTSVKSKNGEKKKNKRDSDTGEKSKEEDSTAIKPEVAAIVQSRGSRISHIIRSKKDSSKIHGYILLRNTEVLDNPNEVS